MGRLHLSWEEGYPLVPPSLPTTHYPPTPPLSRSPIPLLAPQQCAIARMTLKTQSRAPCVGGPQAEQARGESPPAQSRVPKCSQLRRSSPKFGRLQAEVGRKWA